MTTFTWKSLSQRWVLKFAVFSLTWIQCLIVKMLLLQPTVVKTERSLNTAAWGTFLLFLRGSQQVPPLHFQPLILQCLNPTSMGVRKNPHAISCAFFHNRPWALSEYGIVPQSHLQIDQQLLVFTSAIRWVLLRTFFSCSCNLMCLHLGDENKVLFYSCLSHSWVSLDNKSDISCL